MSYTLPRRLLRQQVGRTYAPCSKRCVSPSASQTSSLCRSLAVQGRTLVGNTPGTRGTDDAGYVFSPCLAASTVMRGVLESPTTDTSISTEAVIPGSSAIVVSFVGGTYCTEGMSTLCFSRASSRTVLQNYPGRIPISRRVPSGRGDTAVSTNHIPFPTQPPIHSFDLHNLTNVIYDTICTHVLYTSLSSVSMLYDHLCRHSWLNLQCCHWLAPMILHND